MTISSLLKKTTEDQERLRILQEDYGKTTEDNFSANFIATLRGHHGKTARRLQKTTWNYDSNLMSLCWVLCTKTWSRRVEVKIYLQVRVRKRVFNSFWIVFLCRFWIFLGVSSLVPFPLYLQQFGAGTCHCAWYLQQLDTRTSHFALYLLHVCTSTFYSAWYLQQVGTRTSRFAWYLLHVCTSTFHFAWYLQQVGTSTFHVHGILHAICSMYAYIHSTRA